MGGGKPMATATRRWRGSGLLCRRASCLVLLTSTVPAAPDHGWTSQVPRVGVSLEDYSLEAEPAARWELPRRLREISGLAMTSDDRLLAHNDEVGVVFEIDYRDQSTVKEFQLADAAGPVADDFEGIAVADGRIYLVTSAGRLYESPEGASGESVRFRVHDTGVGLACEVEGLAYDAASRELVLMCKDARSAALAGQVAMFRWSIDQERVNADASTVMPVADFARHIGSGRYRPSGIEQHPTSGNYYVVAARPGAIAEVTPAGEVVAARRFTAGWHRQVEGIAFAADGALIIADEGGGGRGILTVYPGPESRE